MQRLVLQVLLRAALFWLLHLVEPFERVAQHRVYQPGRFRVALRPEIGVSTRCSWSTRLKKKKEHQHQQEQPEQEVSKNKNKRFHLRVLRRASLVARAGGSHGQQLLRQICESLVPLKSAELFPVHPPSRARPHGVQLDCADMEQLGRIAPGPTLETRGKCSVSAAQGSGNARQRQWNTRGKGSGDTVQKAGVSPGAVVP